MSYKKKYSIAIYDADDDLLNVCGTINEFAQIIGKEKHVCEVLLSRAYRKEGKNITMYRNGQCYGIYLINTEDDDEEEEELLEGSLCLGAI